MPTLQKRLKEIREQHNVTLAELAEALGGKEDTGQRYERG